MKRFSLPVVLLLASIVGVACGRNSTASAAAASPNVLVPDKGVGAKFGTPDPLTCSSKVVPKRGGINAAMARQYFICGFDKVNGYGNLFLATNVKIEVGRGVPYEGAGLLGMGDIEPHGKVYAVRGSYDQYLCSPLDKGYMFMGQLQGNNIGKNCTVWHMTRSTGMCYRTSFGDWKCNMTGDLGQQIGDQPPPSSDQ